MSSCAPFGTSASDAPEGAWKSEATIPEPGGVRYRYEWDRDGVVFSEGGDSWSVMTDLGYEVTVNQSYLVSASIQLSQCEDEESTLGRVWSMLFGIPSARAGHSSEYNPAAVTIGVVERVNELNDIDAGTAEGLSERFCTVHYLVAAGDKETLELPDSIQMVDRSLFFEGTWRAPGSDEHVPFTVDTALAWGLLKELYPPGSFEVANAKLELELGDAGVLVVVRRRARALFDGVDFANLQVNVLPTRILSAFFDATEIGVQVAETDG